LKRGVDGILAREKGADAIGVGFGERGADEAGFVERGTEEVFVVIKVLI
jgi:hypothetical protein